MNYFYVYYHKIGGWVKYNTMYLVVLTRLNWWKREILTYNKTKLYHKHKVIYFHMVSQLRNITETK